MLWLLWLACALGAIACVYLFLIKPGPKRLVPGEGALPIAFAHRGLHGKGIPENTAAAFVLAARKGYGIELDVRESGDGVLMVLHDATLERMCGVNKSLSDLTAGEIQRYSIRDSEEKIPTLREVVNAVLPYCPPLIVEMKSEPGSLKTLPEKLFREMSEYPGFWCVESFDPRLLRWYRKNAKHVVRGQLAYDFRRAGEEHHEIFYSLGAHLLMNCMSRPNFVAYRHDTDGNISFRIMSKLFHPTLIAWTVHCDQDFQRLKNRYDFQIFEGFEP